ncbi:MAG: endonuclease III domain-containing protein [Candidatus Omnitrophota bacterium]|nr:endonuclease III domain-containing protein [Candidatus Omnitrophota bacterium]
MSRLKHFRSPAKRALKPRDLARVYRTMRRINGHQNWWPGETSFEVIVGAILTQNTAWTNVEKAIANLKTAKKLSPCALKEMTHSSLARLIRPAGYFNVKAKRLKCFIDYLFLRYKGSLNRMFAVNGSKLREELLAVNGIGPETADSILLYAAGKAHFVIDTYTKRVFSRHHLHKLEADYHEWQSLFVAALPKSVPLFNDYHAQIVNVAKDYCKARVAHCEKCPLRTYL